MSWLKYFRRDSKQQELDGEIASYIAIATDENIAAGMSAEEAALAARRKFGNATLVKEKVRDMNSLTWLEDSWQDVRYGMRILRLNPGFFAVATLSLALGIGANTAIFQILNAVRMRALPVASPQELARIKIGESEHGRSGNISSRNSDLTYPIWQQLRDHQQGFSGVFAFGDEQFNIAARGEMRNVEGLFVSGAFFQTLGVNPALGRVLNEQDDLPGCGSPVAVIGYPFWQREYGGDPQVLGRKISIEGHPVEVVGVAAASFFGVEVGRRLDVAIPMCSEPIINGQETHMRYRNHWWMSAMGRLNPGWTLERAKAQLEAISPQVFESTVPPTNLPENAKWYAKFKLTALPGAAGVSDLRRSYEDPLWLLLGIAGAVLLIACANLANLMLARASVREREMAVRLAIGAGRGRLVRQLLAESALLTIAGTVLGMFLAQALAKSLVSFLSSTDFPLFLDLGIDWRMLAFTASIAISTCLLFGLTPAVRAARTSPGAAMKAGGRSITADRSRFGLRRALVVVQVAISLVLLTGALLFTRSLRNLTAVNSGLDTGGVLIMETGLTNPSYTPERRITAYRNLLERLRATPGITQAASSSVLQLSGNGWTDAIEIPGTPPSPKRQTSLFARVSSGYFETMGIPILAGRDFNDRDTNASTAVALVSRKFSEKFFNGADPIGRQFGIVAGPGEKPERFQVIGVVKDSKYMDLREDTRPIAYISATQDVATPVGVHILIRSQGSLSATAKAAKQAVLSEDGDVLLQFRTFQEQIIDQSLLLDRLMAALSGFFGLLAGVLATVGLYGVISYMVARRKNEIGIRVALGANRFNIVRLVIREAAILLGVGLVIGVAVSAGGGSLTKSMLYGLQAHDPLTIGMAVALLAIVSLSASVLPALRASRLDPIEALREE